MFTVTSAIEGETERHGKYICREYQDVFILQWKGDRKNMGHDSTTEEGRKLRRRCCASTAVVVSVGS
jgi:hypothetical protein